MRVGIIGSGRIGGNAGTLFARAGHEVMFSFSRDPEKLEALAAEVLLGLLDADPGWRPELPSSRPGHFTMADLIVFAGGTGERMP